MRLYLRLLQTLRPYVRLLAATILVTALYALLEGVSIGMISPLTHALIVRGSASAGDTTGVEAAAGTTGVAGGPAGAASGPAEAASGPADGGADAAAGGAGGSTFDVLAPAVGEMLPAGGWLEAPLARLQAFIERELYAAPPMTALTRICVLIVVVFLLKGLVAFIWQLMVGIIEQAVMRDLRNRLFGQLTRLSLAFFHHRRQGELISRVTNDVNLVRAAVTAALFIGVRDSLLVLVSLFWVFWVSWRLALVSIAVIPPSALLIVVLGRKLRRSSTRTQERMADLTSILAETLGGIRVVKAFAMEPFEVTRFRGASQRVYLAFVRLRRYWAVSSPSSEFLGMLAAVAVVFYGGHLILIERALSPDRFFLFLVAMIAMIRPIKKLAGINAELQQGIAAARRIFDVLDLTPRIGERPGAKPVDGIQDAIRFENVSFAYESGRPVLDGIDLELRAGEVLALAGSSGAGKSTLADLIPRFHDPTAGRVTLDGVDLRDLRLADLRRQIGVVTQDVILFNDSVHNNIAYGDGAMSRAAVQAAARAAHADGFIDALPDGYDTVIGDRGILLSGGQRQRLALARAILKDPPILIFDEATSALDAESERLVQKAIARLLEGRTVLVIAHRLTTIRAADRIVVLDGGHLVEEGDHESLLARGGAYARLYGLEAAASQGLALEPDGIPAVPRAAGGE
ncbi:MAG: ABC transporter ATP-binding protein [Candidatus Eiseniibacteriota bacterium]|jgi:subfamily B ATP-binding cassette protein MsbA